MTLKNENAFNAIVDDVVYPVISLNVTDREIFLKHLKQIRVMLMSLMMKQCVALQKLWTGKLDPEDDGCAFDYPYNFNFCFVIKLPHNELIRVVRDKTRPGYMRLNLQSALDQMKKEQSNIDIYLQFKKIISPSGFLIRSEVQNWFMEVLTKVFDANKHEKDKLNESVIHLKLDDIKYVLKYKQSSTGHYIFINVNGNNYSIQFSPAFLLEKSDFKTSHSEPKIFDLKTKKSPIWFAIPKPSVGSRHGRKMVFSVFFPNIENRLIKLEGKSNLRKVICLLLKLGDKQTVHKFKGYFIRNIFLWEYEKQPETFWNQPISDLLIYMIRTILKHVQERKLPFFWEKDINLLDGFTECDCKILGLNLKAILNSLQKFNSIQFVNEDKIMRFFLARNDIKKFKQTRIKNPMNTELAFNINSLTI